MVPAGNHRRFGDLDDGQYIGTQQGEFGLDYALGDPDVVGKDMGTAMIHSLVTKVRRHHGDVGFVVTPEAASQASRRVLEKSGFNLLDVRTVPTEPHDRPMAIYRLPPT